MKVAVVDIGMGNLRSVANALRRAGADTFYAQAPRDLDEADAIVLPGVGAFRTAMSRLTESGFPPVLHEHVLERGKPFLGICLGMQLIGHGSDEGGAWTDGLGWLDGRCERMTGEPAFPVPHVGWNELELCRTDGLFAGVRDGLHYYFDHSFKYAGAAESDVAARARYGKETVIAAVARDGIQAVQFHPERSQAAGAALFANFLRRADRLLAA